jgi:poly(A) polymerase
MAIFSKIKRLLGKQESTKAAADPLAQVTITREHHCISRTDISDNALKVLNRLNDSGFNAYLVGGGVRDLLLRTAPKDFDIATDAHPEQIRKLFSNCRLIGRRFRLAHILFGREIIEVATFRAENNNTAGPQRHFHEGMIVRDNRYGSLEEDAWRRDVTINALYYDANTQSIIDFTGGFHDIENKTLRLIGEPSTRYQEDPVRILRNIRFAAKLDFLLDSATQAPIAKLKEKIALVPKSRLYEEVLKLFHGGYAKKTWALLQQYDITTVLFPQTQESLADNTQAQALLEYTFNNTDQRIHQGKPITPAFLLAALLWQPLQNKAKMLEDEGTPPLPALELAMRHVIAQQLQTLTIPRRFTKVMREIWLLQYRLPRRYGKRPMRILEHPRFRAGYDFLLLRAKAGEVAASLGKWWTQFQTATEEEQIAMCNALNKTRRPRKKRPQKTPSQQEKDSKGNDTT